MPLDTERIPLTHIPAERPVQEWSRWGALRSPKQLRRPQPPGTLDQIEWSHSFLYAGPCCYAASVAGQSAMYFRPEVEAVLDGAVCPFDTGECRPARDGGRLQPYATQDDEAVCVAQIEASSRRMTGWRGELERWLHACYSQPDRYLETSDDPFVDGAPDRTEPPELLEHNGERGRAKHDRCADRRAWTWELRSTEPVPFDQLALIHVQPNQYRDARAFVRDLGAPGRRIRIEQTRGGAPAGTSTLYRQSNVML